jgi:serine/threonine-protein kinase RsbW
MLSDSNMIAVEIPANLQYLNILNTCVRTLLGYVENLAEPEMTVCDVELAVEEISTNIVQHAYGCHQGKIQATFLLSNMPPQISITFHDKGAAFNPDEVLEPRLGELQEHGFGLFLVKQVMNQVEYRSTRQGNQWKLAKNLLLVVPPSQG